MSTVSVLSLGKGKTLKIVNEELKGEHDKLPHFFVWDGSQLVTLEQKDTVFFARDLSDPGKNDELLRYMRRELRGSKCLELIKQVKDNVNTEYIVIIVKVSGFESLSEIKYCVKSRGIDIGNAV